MALGKSLSEREPYVACGVRLPVSAYRDVVNLAREQGATTLSPTLRDLVLRGLAATKGQPDPKEAECELEAV